VKLPLMPKATAVWLVDNTTLTFDQIAEFCGMHPLEVKGIADGEVAVGIVGADPVQNSQITRDEIKKGEADSGYRLKLLSSVVELPRQKTGGARYTPVSRRSDRPDAIAWLLKFHPEVSDAQIQKLVGTTKKTIDDIRQRSHWNMPNIKPRDPVSLGICSQLQLDGVVRLAQEKKMAREAREQKAALQAAAAHGTPLPKAPEPIFEGDGTDDGA
jgi:hypothetical protein